MIGIDTNILVRVLIQDDPGQVAAARAFLATLTPEKPGYITHMVLIELVWVLISRYKYDRAAVAVSLKSVLQATEFHVEQAEAALEALRLFRHSQVADFDDCLIAQKCAAAGCDYTATFDKTAAKHAGMRPI